MEKYLRVLALMEARPRGILRKDDPELLELLNGDLKQLSTLIWKIRNRAKRRVNMLRGSGYQLESHRTDKVVSQTDVEAVESDLIPPDPPVNLGDLIPDALIQLSPEDSLKVVEAIINPPEPESALVTASRLTNWLINEHRRR